MVRIPLLAFTSQLVYDSICFNYFYKKAKDEIYEKSQPKYFLGDDACYLQTVTLEYTYCWVMTKIVTQCIVQFKTMRGSD